MAGIREIKDPINAQGLEDIIYNFQYLYLKLVALSGGQDVEQMLADLERLIREANEAMESYEVLEPRLIAAAEDAEAQAEAARIQAEYVASVKPAIDYFTNQQTNLQNQINQLVINGDSSPEAAQARVGYDSVVYSTLKQRLDAEIQSLINSIARPTANLQKGTNTIGGFVGFENNFSNNVITNDLIDGNDAAKGYVTRVKLESPIVSNTRLAMIVSEENIITYEFGKRYRVSFEARANKNSSLNYTFLINRGGVGNVSLSTKPITTDFTLFEYTFNWQSATTLSQLLIGTNELKNENDWIEVKNLIIHEGYSKIPYKPFQNPVLPKASNATVQSGVDDNSVITPLRATQNFVKKTTTRTSNIDLNSIRTEGEYALGANITANGNNFTNAHYGTLKVVVSSDVVSQTIYSFNGYKYYRSLNTTPSSTQPDFVRYANKDISIDSVGQVSSLQTNIKTTLVAALNELNNLSFKRRNSIPVSGDFNNYTNAGIYRCTFDGQVAANFPGFAYGYGNLIVFRSDNEANTTVNQFYIPDNTGQFFFRTVYLNSAAGWRPWRKVATTVETGDLSALQTSDKSNLVAALNEVLQSVSNFKSTIAGAITDRGINTPATANSATMANNIALIGQPKQASGLVNVNTESLPFSFYDMSATEDANYVTVSGLNFRPRRIIVFNPNAGIPSVTEYSYQLAVLDESIRIYRLNGAQITTVVSNFKNNVSSAFVNNGGFRLPVDGTGNNWEWYAYEY